MPSCCAPAMSPIPRSRNSSRRCTSGSTRSRPSCCSLRWSSTGSTTPRSTPKLADPALAHYRPWLRDVRALRPYQLSDELEKLLHEKSVAGRAAWVRLFDETMAELRFPFRGRELTEAEAMHLLSDPRRRGAARGGAVDRRGAGRERPRLRADHQHARQGQGDRGPLAQIPAADLGRATCRILSRTRSSTR